MMKRSSGIILPIYALPAPYGVGTLGQAAFDFVDFLVEADQAWWQMLPIGPTVYGDSPYKSPSTFAGNPYFIDLDILASEGLLKQSEIDSLEWGSDPARVDYYLLFKNRMKLLRLAYERGWKRDRANVEDFCKKNASWINDYALFMALKNHFDCVEWTKWPDEDIKCRKPSVIAYYNEHLAEEIHFNEYIQFHFFKQWERLRDYARKKGVSFIGDIPIYVALDSADAWANPSQFMLDENNIPTAIAGVPPDAFTAEGQLWNNPLYDYDAMEADGFDWWIKRVSGASQLFDVIRIDHFRGFESFWAVPAGDKTALNGHWIKGPGMKLVGVLQNRFPQISFIAEDLGYETPEVAALLAESGLPGMKVLEFAFDSRNTGNRAHMPHAYTSNCVCYVGTHDNPTIMQWREEADSVDVQNAIDYLGLNDREGFAWGFIRSGMASVARLFVAQMQDYLELGAEARTNTPNTLGNNWQWRMTDGQATPELAARIASATKMYGRSAREWQK